MLGITRPILKNKWTRSWQQERVSQSHGRLGAKLGLKLRSLEFKFDGPCSASTAPNCYHPLPLNFGFKGFWSKIMKQNENAIIGHTGVGGEDGGKE